MGGKTSDKLSADNDWMEPGAGSDLHCLFSKYLGENLPEQT